MLSLKKREKMADKEVEEDETLPVESKESVKNEDTAERSENAAACDSGVRVKSHRRKISPSSSRGRQQEEQETAVARYASEKPREENNETDEENDEAGAVEGEKRDEIAKDVENIEGHSSVTNENKAVSRKGNRRVSIISKKDDNETEEGEEKFAEGKKSRRQSIVSNNSRTGSRRNSLAPPGIKYRNDIMCGDPTSDRRT